MLEHATILHPTDFSPFSEHAFQVACGSRTITAAA